MELEYSLRYSQKPATHPFPESQIQTTSPSLLSLRSILILFSHLCLSVQIVSNLMFSKEKYMSFWAVSRAVYVRLIYPPSFVQISDM